MDVKKLQQYSVPVKRITIKNAPSFLWVHFYENCCRNSVEVKGENKVMKVNGYCFMVFTCSDSAFNV